VIHAVARGSRTLCGIAARAGRDVPLDSARHAECRRCRAAIRKHDRDVLRAEGRDAEQAAAAIRRGMAHGGIDGIEALPGAMRATLRRQTLRVVR
jgi:hypothetical protein